MRKTGLDADLLREVAGDNDSAVGFLGWLTHVAEPNAADDLINDVVTHFGIPRWAAAWRHEKIRRVRAGRAADYQSMTFVVGTRIDGLSADVARAVLERVAVAAYFAGHDDSYVRVRFEGNGKAVVYWDDEADSGVVMIYDDIEDFDEFNPPWPEWLIKADQLADDLEALGEARRTA